jgi:hypothetical protein
VQIERNIRVIYVFFLSLNVLCCVVLSIEKRAEKHALLSNVIIVTTHLKITKRHAKLHADFLISTLYLSL